jgi:hypothetical protein
LLTVREQLMWKSGMSDEWRRMPVLAFLAFVKNKLANMGRAQQCHGRSRVLHEQLLYQYHLQRVQPPIPLDFRPRQEFGQLFLRQCGEDPFLRNLVLFTDKADFTWSGILNFR